MKKLPMKSELLKSFLDRNEMWDYEAVDGLMKLEDSSSDYLKMNARFWLMELSTNGMLEVVDQAMDDGTHFGQGKTVTRYKLTDFGRMKIETMLE